MAETSPQDFVALYKQAQTQMSVYEGQQQQFSAQWASATSELLQALNELKKTLAETASDDIREELSGLFPDGINADSLEKEETFIVLRDGIRAMRDKCNDLGIAALSPKA